MDTSERAGRLTVGVLGAGRVGSVVGAALARAGHHVVAASGVSRASVALAERHLPGVPLLPADEVVARAELVCVAVPTTRWLRSSPALPRPMPGGPGSWSRT